jgi:hypothetical protein
MSARAYLSYVILGVLLTAVMIGWAFYLRAEDEAFRSTAIHTEATVVAHADAISKDSSGDERLEKYDQYEFTTATGQLTRFKSPVTVTQPRREIGARANTLYAPGAPSDARLDDETRQTMSRILLWSSPIGLAFSAVVLIVFLRTRRHARTFEASH